MFHIKDTRFLQIRRKSRRKIRPMGALTDVENLSSIKLHFFVFIRPNNREPVLTLSVVYPGQTSLF